MVGKVRWTLIPALLFVVSACARIDVLKYEDYVADIDGLSALEISTYPADFGRKLKHVPFIYQHVESHNKLYFQVFIRDKERAGKNPHVESIVIHSFSYRFGNQPDTVLMTDYEDNFWMQGQPNYNENYADTRPVLFVPDAAITVTIEFTLNGKFYEFEGDMPAARKLSYRSLLVHSLR